MKLIGCIFWLILCFSSAAQEKVSWKNVYNDQSKNVEMTAYIAEGWHLYSQHLNNQIGPVPTSFSFSPNELISMEGKVKEPKAIQEYDENFEATLDFFKEKALFTQSISVQDSTTLEVVITYMVCNDTMCLPPVDEKFSIEIHTN
jgi:hypothetical protein